DRDPASDRISVHRLHEVDPSRFRLRIGVADALSAPDHRQCAAEERVPPLRERPASDRPHAVLLSTPKEETAKGVPDASSQRRKERKVSGCENAPEARGSGAFWLHADGVRADQCSTISLRETDAPLASSRAK